MLPAKVLRLYALLSHQSSQYETLLPEKGRSNIPPSGGASLGCDISEREMEKFECCASLFTGWSGANPASAGGPAGDAPDLTIFKSLSFLCLPALNDGLDGHGGDVESVGNFGV